MARRLLKGSEQRNFFILIFHANEHHNSHRLPLKEAIAKHQDSWNLRFTNFSLGLLGEIFDVKHFITEARSLKWKEHQKPWLKTPA